MTTTLEKQVFVSYAREHRDKVEALIGQFRAAEVAVWWDKEIGLGDNWAEKLETKIKQSRHFLLYCNVEAKASEKVNHEIKTFRESAKNDPSRKLFVLRAPDCASKHVPQDLGEVQHADSVIDVIIYVLKEARNEALQDLGEFKRQAASEKVEIEEQLAIERGKVADARKYYRHRRFWGPFAENGDVHIFTCGRDIRPDDARPRGTGGYRTNIDKWDYRAVLGITHYFASNYPGAKLTIEDPASKLQQEDIDKTHVLANRIAEIGTLLKDKDCIIIGSPDVNDFAEIALSRIHGIHPYDNDRKKSRGFVLIRKRKNTASAFYWRTEGDEPEGIARLGPPKRRMYKYEPPAEAASETGTMHGILIVADNPFSDSGLKRRIMIFSGFSGVATNAMAKFLTEETYLPSFFDFDEAQAQQGRAVEALIRVKYIVESGSENKDARQIDGAADSITFEELVGV